jgi:hypothetical protein
MAAVVLKFRGEIVGIERALRDERFCDDRESSEIDLCAVFDMAGLHCVARRHALGKPSERVRDVTVRSISSDVPISPMLVVVDDELAMRWCCDGTR